MRFGLIFIFIFNGLVFAQPFKMSWNAAIDLSIPHGSFASYSNANRGKNLLAGFSIDLLKNVQYKIYKESPVYAGLNIGFVDLGNYNVPADVAGDFYNSQNYWYLNGMLRFLPKIQKTKLKPYLTLGIGPAHYSSKIFERVSTDENFKIDGIGNWSRNYQIGTGVLLAFKKTDINPKFINIGVGYRFIEGSQKMLFNSAFVNAQGFSSYALGLESTQLIELKLSIAGFN